MTPGLTIGHGDPIRIHDYDYGYQRRGWYRHDPVHYNGTLIGHIQVRSFTSPAHLARSSPECITLLSSRGSCVLGSDPEWLLRQHLASLQPQ